MKITTSPFWKENQHIFNAFDEAYIFGSALDKERPQDIDLILIYGDNFNDELKRACDTVRESVFQYFGCEAHLTVLSASEKTETQFLKLVRQKIRISRAD